MIDLWAVALPLLIMDVVNPVLLAAVVLCVSRDRPLLRSLALLAGHTTAYLLCGAVVIYGLAEPLERLAAPVIDKIQNPRPEDFILGAVLGALLLWVALRWKTSPPEPSETPPEKANKSLAATFAFGAAVNFIAMPFALPYFAFLNQLMKLEGPLVWANLLLYNILYPLVFLLVPMAVAIFGRHALPVLERLEKGFERVSAYTMPVLFAVAGAALLLDAVLYFATGRGLI